MSYDLNLTLPAMPVLTPDGFAASCRGLGLELTLSPDFTADGSQSPVCCKFSGKYLSENDTRDYFTAVEYSLTVLSEDKEIALPAPRKKWWQRRSRKGKTVRFSAGAAELCISCGIDSLEVPFAYLLAYAMAGEDGVLYDPQTDTAVQGQTAIGSLAENALNSLKNTPVDRLLLHEFDGWL